jgi:ribosomal protein L23
MSTSITSAATSTARQWLPQHALRLPNVPFILLPPPQYAPANVFRFQVPLNYNKIQIKNYLEKLYNVKITKVNTVIYTGKRIVNYKAINPQTKKDAYTYEKDSKKALVTVTEEHAFTYPTLLEQVQLGSTTAERLASSATNATDTATENVTVTSGSSTVS